MKDPKRVAAGKRSKRKGNNNERALAKSIAEWWGTGSFVRTPSSGGWSARAVRDNFRAVGDIMADQPNFPFCIETKHSEGWSTEQLLTAPCSQLFQWWQQTLDECPEYLVPLLVARRNRSPHLVIFDPNYKLFQELDELKDLPHLQYTGPLTNNSPLRRQLVVITLKDFFTINPERFKVHEEKAKGLI